jgi:hypothetical protein
VLIVTFLKNIIAFIHDSQVENHPQALTECHSVASQRGAILRFISVETTGHIIVNSHTYVVESQ